MSLFCRVRLWAALILVSGLLASLLAWAAVPAAVLLGPMIVGVAFALGGAPLAVSPGVFGAAQAVIGCLVAVTITPSTLAALGQQWLPMLVVIVHIIVSGALVGLALIRFGTVTGSTAAWGVSPGGAAAMSVMAESYGADVRMVAFMQYLRMFVVVLTASGVSRLLLGHEVEIPARAALSLGLDAPVLPLALTLLVIACGMLLARRLRVPAGALLLPMLIGAALNASGLLHITLPAWLLWITYACLGWYVGLRFTPHTVRHALQAIPQLLLATFLLIVLCGFAAWMLSAWLGVDPLSAYLATSPGGLDAVVVIAAGSGCDVPFVVAQQTLRLFAVVLMGPLVARLLCRFDARRRGVEATAADRTRR
ncbi:AbrB family transcriptional regulator [Desulfolutivibrio sp.]|uniref:AbrB family transcriptional regulator n=1 Tax=Desulfolutivibrio sp. TaxID=2773296 RepID=UPI002F96AB08